MSAAAVPAIAPTYSMASMLLTGMMKPSMAMMMNRAAANGYSDASPATLMASSTVADRR